MAGIRAGQIGSRGHLSLPQGCMRRVLHAWAAQATRPPARPILSPWHTSSSHTYIRTTPPLWNTCLLLAGCVDELPSGVGSSWVSTHACEREAAEARRWRAGLQPCLTSRYWPP